VGYYYRSHCDLFRSRKDIQDMRLLGFIRFLVASDVMFNASHFAVIKGQMGQDDITSTSISSNHVHRLLLDIALYIPRRLLKRDGTGEDETRNRNLDG
jgi:hypothetical protein